MKIECPYCNQKYEVDDEFINHEVICENCNSSFLAKQKDTAIQKLIINPKQEISSEKQMSYSFLQIWNNLTFSGRCGIIMIVCGCILQIIICLATKAPAKLDTSLNEIGTAVNEIETTVNEIGAAVNRLRLFYSIALPLYLSSYVFFILAAIKSKSFGWLLGIISSVLLPFIIQKLFQ